MIYGIDISHWQGTNVDLHRARSEGFDFAIFKASEGAGYVDPQFVRNLREGRDADLLVAAYHYQRGDASAAAQATNIMSVVPTSVPVILDVERGGGGPDLSRDILNRLRAAGYRSPLIYLPEWYWRQLGTPNLTGLPPLWYSRYANYEGGYASQIWERNAGWFAQFWGGYGGLHVEIMQFTSSATVAGHTPVDANAYRGTRQELAALLDQEDDMQLDDIVGERPNGTTYNVRDVLANLYYGEFSTLFGVGPTPTTWDTTHRAVVELQATAAAQSAAIAALANDADLTVEAIEQIVRDAVQQHIEITGTVQINSKE